MMVNDHDKEMSEKLFDAILKSACEEAEDQELESYPSKEELDKMYPRSLELDKRIMDIIAKTEKPHKHKFIINAALKSVACLCILCTMSALVLFNVEASRNFILNAIIDIRSDHVAFEFLGTEHSQITESESRPIPDGFEYMGTQVFKTSIMSIYSNSYGHQIIIQKHLGINLGTAIGTDYREFSIIDMNGQEAFLFERGSCAFS